jgi:chromosome segregation ATPase
MHGKPAHYVIPRDQVEANIMEARIARIESDVSSIKSNVATVQLDVRDLRNGLAAANEAIADVKNAVATLDGEVRALGTKVDANIAATAALDAKFDRLDTKVDAQVNRLDAKIDAQFGKLDAKIDAQFGKLDAKVDEGRTMHVETGRQLADLQAMQKAILWALRLLLALVALIPVGIAIAKVLHWI